MIKSNELRARNWVLFKGSPRQVYFAYDRGVAFYAGCGWDNNVHTENILYKGIDLIPITAEILEKCGFSLHSDNRPNGFLNYKLPNGFYISQVWGCGQPINRNDGDWIWGEYYTKISYLHQLQNLYFALTGKELDVKL